MATYIMLSTLTDEGRKTLKERPDRVSEVNKEIEAMGGRIHSQYAVLGDYDFVTVLDAPSNEVVAKISVELGSRGTIRIMTIPAISVTALSESLKAK
jgi:uncharacterized protein with GYD domain